MGLRIWTYFGSVALDEACPDSDVDFLVGFAVKASPFDLFWVRHYLEDLLGCDVDLGTIDALKEHLRQPILEDVIHVF